LSTPLRFAFPVVSFLPVFPPISICVPLLPNSCYMPRPYHPSWLDYSNYTWRRVQVMKFLNMQCSRNPSMSETSSLLSWQASFLRWGVVSPTPNHQAEGPPLVGCPRLLIRYIRSCPPKLEGHAVVARDPPNMDLNFIYFKKC
jgi:hypothetical protein